MARTFFPPVPPRTASINIRLSKEAAEENLSKDGMLQDCLALCERMGVDPTYIHIDDGISGSVRNRPGFKAWLDDGREARVDHMVAWHVDRMTREGVNVAGLILDTIEGKDPETGKQVRHPVRLLDVKGLDSFGDPTAFRFQFVIAAEIARAERERMRDRNRSAYRRGRAAGRWAGGPPPYGFQAIDNPDGPGRVLVQEPAEAAFIRTAAERVLTGQNISQVTRWANLHSGMTPRRTATWGRKSLAHILTGYPAQGRVMAIVDDVHVPVVDETGTPVTLEPILTPDQSAAVRQLLAVKDPDASKGGRKPSRVLSGLVRCSGCGAKLTVSRRRNGHVGYRCPEGYSQGLCKRPVSISAPKLDALIERTFLANHGEGQEYVKRAQVAGAALIEAAEEARTAALNALAAAPTQANLEALQRAATAVEEAEAMPHETTVVLVPTGRTIAEAWTASGMEDRRDLLLTNYAEVLVLPSRQGRRTIDPERLRIVSQPPLVYGVSDDDWSPGVMVVH